MENACSTQVGSILVDIFGANVRPNVELTQEDQIHWVPVYRHFKPALLGAISNLYTRTIDPEFTNYIRNSDLLAEITNNLSRNFTVEEFVGKLNEYQAFIVISGGEALENYVYKGGVIVPTHDCDTRFVVKNGTSLNDPTFINLRAYCLLYIVYSVEKHQQLQGYTVDIEGFAQSLQMFPVDKLVVLSVVHTQTGLRNSILDNISVSQFWYSQTGHTPEIDEYFNMLPPEIVRSGVFPFTLLSTPSGSPIPYAPIGYIIYDTLRMLISGSLVSKIPTCQGQTYGFYKQKKYQQKLKALLYTLSLPNVSSAVSTEVQRSRGGSISSSRRLPSVPKRKGLRSSSSSKKRYTRRRRALRSGKGGYRATRTGRKV